MAIPVDLTSGIGPLSALCWLSVLMCCRCCRLDSVAAAVTGGSEDPLDNEEQVGSACTKVMLRLLLSWPSLSSSTVLLTLARSLWTDTCDLHLQVFQCSRDMYQPDVLSRLTSLSIESDARCSHVAEVDDDGISSGSDPNALPCGLQVADQLDAIPFLCRFQYARTAEYLLRFLDPLVAAYTEAATPGALPPSQCSCHPTSTSQGIAAHQCVYVDCHANHNNMAAAPDAGMALMLAWGIPPLLIAVGLACATGKVEAQALAVMEGQLTWLVHLVGAIIRGRLSSSSAESQVGTQGTHTVQQACPGLEQRRRGGGCTACVQQACRCHQQSRKRNAQGTHSITTTKSNSKSAVLD